MKCETVAFNTFIKDYATTVRANKALAIGYALFAASIVISGSISKKQQVEKPWIAAFYATYFAGIILPITTSYGKYTLRAIRRTREHIDENGTIDKEFQDKVGRYYCSAVGVTHVAEERGLEHMLTEKTKERASTIDGVKKWAPTILTCGLYAPPGD